MIQSTGLRSAHSSPRLSYSPYKSLVYLSNPFNFIAMTTELSIAAALLIAITGFLFGRHALVTKFYKKQFTIAFNQGRDSVHRSYVALEKKKSSYEEAVNELVELFERMDEYHRPFYTDEQMEIVRYHLEEASCFLTDTESDAEKKINELL